MGVSFKVAKAGKRYQPKLHQTDQERETEAGQPTDIDSKQRENKGVFVSTRERVTERSYELAKCGWHRVSEDTEVSFSLNLFPNGFSIGKAKELSKDIPKHLHPYDRASETLFSAIEYGWLPGDIFDDIPCKYVNGALLCEIRDYRYIYSQDGDTTRVDKSPVISKVALQMCMENVINDISSIADDSWTYNDLLEFESRILKTLQPELHLSPKPMLGRIFEKPLPKKVNLGITWIRKKRKLNEASATDLACMNLFPGNHTSEVHVTKHSQSQSDQSTFPSPVPISQENNILQETILQSGPLQFKSVSTAITRSNNIFSPKPNHDNYCIEPRKPTGLILGDRVKCETPAQNQGPITKKPKQDPPDFSHQQNNIVSELQWKSILLNQRIEAEKNLRERTREKIHPSLLINNGVKEEPMETSSFSCLDARKTADNFLSMGTEIDQYNLHQSQLLKAYVPHTSMQRNHMGQSGANLTNEILSRKENASQNSRVSPRVGGFPLPMEGKSNSRLKCSTMNRVNSLAGTKNMGTPTCSVSASFPPMGTVICDPVHKTSVARTFKNDDLVLDRLSKIILVTERFGFNRKKLKFSQDIGRKQISPSTMFLDFHLGNSEDNGKLKDIVTEGSGLNNSKTRTLTFLPSSRISQVNENFVYESQNKLVILEKLDEGTVEASALYGSEKTNPIELHRLLTFPSSHHADLFAAQLTSLMMREGFCLADDQIEPRPLDVDKSFAIQNRTVAYAVDPPMQTSILDQTQYRYRQLPSHGNFSGGNLFTRGHIHSVPQLSDGYLSKLELDIASQIGPMHPKWQHITNKRAILQFQALQRERLQQQILQKRRVMMMGGLGTMQLGGGGGAQGIGNIGFRSFGNTIMAEHQGRALMNGVSLQRKAGLPMHPTNNPGDKLYIGPPDQRQEMRLRLQTLEAAALTEYVGSPFGQASHPQMGPQQLSSAPVANHGSPELSSRAPGSLASCNTSSSIELCGFTGGGGGLNQSGGV